LVHSLFIERDTNTGDTEDSRNTKNKTEGCEDKANTCGVPGFPADPTLKNTYYTAPNTYKTTQSEHESTVKFTSTMLNRCRRDIFTTSCPVGCDNVARETNHWTGERE